MPRGQQQERKNQFLHAFYFGELLRSTYMKIYYFSPIYGLIARAGLIIYSDLKLVTGLARAALTAWRLTVTRAMITATAAAPANIHQCTSMR